jgi:hypothetical protein
MERVIATYHGNGAFSDSGVEDLAKLAQESTADMMAFLSANGVPLGGGHV